MADPVAAAWVTALESAYSLAKAERLADLRDRKPKTFDARGLHPYSVEVGRVLALEEIMAVVTDFDPILLRREARRDALDEYRQEVYEAFGTEREEAA